MELWCSRSLYIFLRTSSSSRGRGPKIPTRTPRSSPRYQPLFLKHPSTSCMPTNLSLRLPPVVCVIYLSKEDSQTIDIHAAFSACSWHLLARVLFTQLCSKSESKEARPAGVPSKHQGIQKVFEHSFSLEDIGFGV